MTKKLNTDYIRTELSESVFFRTPQPPAVPEIQPPADPAVPPSAIPERVNARTHERVAGKRIITRNSFEIYEDQMTSLRELSYQEKRVGKLGSMSRMVRDAIDRYLTDAPQQPDE